jgi:hypothetical protein
MRNAAPSAAAKRIQTGFAFILFIGSKSAAIYVIASSDMVTIASMVINALPSRRLLT